MQKVWKTSREVKIESLGDNVFIFKFGSVADKRSIMIGGPWHFDGALIVLREPMGIRDVKKQEFRHTAFWVQIHDVPIMCMSKEMAEELGKAIGQVEEVDTDAAGECWGQFLRMRISVDITKPLKKLIELEQEGEEEEDIPMRVMYERLPNFCYCCGRIGHHYRECVHYKLQSKDKLPYGQWLKASITPEKFKQSKRRDRWDSDVSKIHVISSRPAERETSRNQVEEEQGRTRALNQDDDGIRIRLSSGMDSASKQKEEFQRVGGLQLMQKVIDNGQPDDYSVGYENINNDVTDQRDVPRRTEKKEGYDKQREEKSQSKKVDESLDGTSEREGSIEREDMEIGKDPDGRSQPQKIIGPLSQIESEIVSNESGPKAGTIKHRRKKWKYQARNVVGSGEIKEGLSKLKRPHGDIDWESPELKKSKLSNQRNMDTKVIFQETKPVGISLIDEKEVGDDRMEFQNEENGTSAVAGIQHRRQP